MDSTVAGEPVNQDEEKGIVVKDPSHRDGDDPSLKMWTLCISQTDKLDTAMAERWKADMDGILLYTGIFSATVAAFLVESYKLLKPDPGEISARLLREATEQLAAISNGTHLPAPPAEEPFQPKRYAVHVNILWFLSLFLSLSCALSATLVQKWASRYVRLTQSSTTPQRRVRLRTYLFDGVQKFQTRWVVENISLLMHAAIFLFFAGLIEFLFAANDEVAVVILVAVCVLAAAYIVVTALPVFFHQCPYQTPLTSVIWYMGHLFVMGTLCVLACSNRIRAKIEESWRHTWNGIDKLLMDRAEHKLKIDEMALKSALNLCHDEGEMETFLDAIPGYLWPGDNFGTRVANIGSLLSATGEEPPLGQRIVQLFISCIDLDRRMDSDVRRRRAITCTRAIWEISRAFLSQGLRVELPESASHILQRLSRDHDHTVAFAALSTVAMLERALMKRLPYSEGKDGSVRSNGNGDKRLIAVTDFITRVLPVIPHVENLSHEDFKATRRTLEELCDGLEGKKHTFSASAQSDFVEALGKASREHDALVTSTAQHRSDSPMETYYSVIISSTKCLVNTLDGPFQDMLRENGERTSLVE